EQHRKLGPAKRPSRMHRHAGGPPSPSHLDSVLSPSAGPPASVDRPMSGMAPRSRRCRVDDACSTVRRFDRLPRMEPISFETDPSSYKHWKLEFDGPIAFLWLDIQEDGGLRPGYQLKLNSYDLSVDIELADALQRLRFEHPEVRALVIGSKREKIFSAGANIFMLGSSTHGFKVNFCKFTNETRLGI